MLGLMEKLGDTSLECNRSGLLFSLLLFLSEVEGDILVQQIPNLFHVLLLRIHSTMVYCFTCCFVFF